LGGISSIHFSDTLRGWVIGRGNFVSYTTDGGTTWDTSRHYYAGVYNIGLSDVRSTSDGQTVCGVGREGLILISNDGGLHWSAGSRHLASYLQDIKMVSNDVGWAVGDQILRTTDGGRDWIRQKAPGTGYHASISAVDSLTAWCVGGDSSKILKTTDGGLSWSEQTTRASQFWGRVYFINKDIGWVTGGYGALFKTTDGGVHWDSVNSGTQSAIFGIFFRDTLHGWFVGDQGDIRKTSDGGITWYVVPSPAYPYQLHDVFFTSDQVGWIVGESLVLKTTDGGLHWIVRIGNYGSSNFWRIKFLDELNGWTAASSGNVLLRTTDGGESWRNVTAPSESFYSLEVSREGAVWVVAGGTILYNPGALVSVKIAEVEQPHEFFLNQNYPNPFNPLTEISFGLSTRTHVRLEVFDLLGQLVATLTDESKPPGIYTATWDPGMRATGVYFFRMTAGEFVQTRKAILLR
jgi:photosystem II stability/assembly factor-like uncharacterized protein